MCEYCELSEEGYITDILYDVVPSADYVDDLIFGAYVHENQLILDCWKPNPFEEGEIEEHSMKNEINYCPICGRNLKPKSPAARTLDMLGGEF